MNIPHSPNPFNAMQFHIHTFSEHQILGQGDKGYFPAELHVVHFEEPFNSAAVFGTMISVGAADHPMFEWFLQGWEAAAQQVEDECVAGTSLLDDGNSVVESYSCPAIGSRTIFNGTSPEFPAGGPNVYELPTNPDFGTFTYKGGLTTPACSELVNWNLLDTPMEISASQLDRLNSLILCYVAQNTNEDGSLKSCGFGTVASQSGSTSRPPQPLLGREVIHRCPGGPEVIIPDIGVDPAYFETNPEPIMDMKDNTTESDCSKVEGGMIALIVILSLAVLVGGFVFIQRRAAKAQAARIQSQFAKQIAKTVSISGGFSPESLAGEFRKADKDLSGSLDKAEVRAFMGGKMDARDFDAMIAAIDIDGSGTVDYAKFCAFIAHIDTSKTVKSGNADDDDDEKVVHT